MSSRSRPSRRERQDDPLEAVKPLVVLVLFGTILYGAYTVVQKGPTPGFESGGPASDELAAAPAFNPPQVDLPPVTSAPPAVGEAAAPGATPPGSPAALPTAVTLPAVRADAWPNPPGPPAATGAERPLGAGFPGPGVAAAHSGGPPPAASEPAGASLPPDRTATYLNAMSAPPPGPDAVAASARPDRYASLPVAQLPAAVPSSASGGPPITGPAPFAAVWSDAHEKLAAGRYAEALQALSAWHDDPSLGLEESQRLDDLLGQLAGTVIYSQRDLMLPPHVVAPGEALPMIAAPLGVSWQLLAKINGIDHADRLVPGEHLKLVRGPFDAVVSVSRRRLTLQLHGNYAGGFPVVVGRQFLARVGGSLPVVEVQRGDPATTRVATLQRSVLLGDGLVIEAVDDPGLLADGGPSASLVVSVRDLDEISDILGPGSRVLVRQ